ncbi:tRNA dihydrouridine(20/20a) synthase DusA [Algicella marina]|uniref:tRNA-dihydrouridine(20/20a) synthase n=1 Tax=Algicella marina TaxID=2683284 RepID=A0A6P1T1Q0_9RHOB|nr:tRNA dihydrouridine(20/20a) synthase DusA [Algicella marina]QHQ34452.1 tRNA dihydrouridine(20/20a) synthase DusA [Algicella marina]
MQINQHARLSCAPMMDWTDRHCRVFHRHFSASALLYTEMITSAALVNGDARHLLDYSEQEHPVALQLGGSDPLELADAVRIAAPFGYDEINLNVGCPSDRVQSGCFGAILMERPDLVAHCVEAMVAATDMPVTVKCRIGVDAQEPREVLPAFIAKVRDAGAAQVTIHARKAWLQGLSPKENRDIPPLDYEIVREMKAAFPDLPISVNGGINSLAEVEEFLASGLDGVMVGRAAYHQPANVLSAADQRIFGTRADAVSAERAVSAMLPYIESELGKGVPLNRITRHMLGAFAGRAGARHWRRTLSEGAHKRGAGPELVERALAQVTALAA